MGGGGGKGEVEITVGYKYYAGLHMVICETADSLLAISVGEKTAWSGTASANTTIHIDKPGLFGGEEKEGGVVGDVDVLFGGDTQGQNSYLVSKLGSNVPAFRGVLSLVAKQMYLSAMNPYIKPWWVKVRRIPAKGWYSSYASINGRANPVHIIYELITDHGLGQIDNTSFQSAAYTLYQEGFGLNFIWTGGSLEEFIQNILDHIGGYLFVNPTTGLFQIRLVRNDYTVSSLPVLDESNIKEMVSYQRIALSDTVNQLTIYYTDEGTGEERSVTVQDLANFAAQGKIVSDDRKYHGIPTLQLATQVAMRDMQISAAMLSKVTLKVNRKAYNFTPGGLFVFKWPKLGIEQMVFRIGEIDYGLLTDSTITIEAIEDVYSLPSTTYVEPQDPYWQDPVGPPAPCPQERTVEVPYWDIVRNLSPADFDYLPKNEGVGFLAALGSRPAGVAFNYSLYTSTSSTGTYTKVGKGDFCPIAFLSQAVGYTDTTFNIENGVDLDLARTGQYFYAIIEDEIVRVNSITTNSVSVGRGCLDTVPKPHNAGVPIFFASGWYGLDRTERTAGQTMYAKLCPVTGKGELALSSATARSLIFNSRFDRPYPPAYPKINGVVYPEGLSVEGVPINLSWYHRDRTQQTAYIVADTEGNIGPETGTTYTVEVRNKSNNSLITSQAGITANSVAITLSVDVQAYVDLWSVRDEYTSLQKHRFTIDYYRAQRRLTQDGVERATEDGKIRIVEG